MSLARFEGWEPTSTTTYEYDDQGRVIRSTTVAEPEYTELQRGYMLALQRYEDSICDGCGELLAESTLPEREGRYRVKDIIRCHGCDAMLTAADAHMKAGATQVTALRWPVEYVPKKAPKARPQNGG